MYIRRQFLR